ncbi:MAG: acetyltransferase [Armatimonadetes bacterium]|nr:MAG: acetyltransferase [Armatimonadota bacterium]
MTAKRPLLIVGAGGFGRETASLVADLDTYEVQGFLDDDEKIHGTLRSGIKVMGPIAAALDSDAALVLTTGSPSNFGSREAIFTRLGLDPQRYATLVHPSVFVGAGCTVGHGSVIHAGSVLTADVTVGDHVVAMPSVVLTHDDQVGDFVTFGAGALIAGRVTISKGAYIGSGARVREDCVVGSGALVGMGSVVVSDIPAETVWAGVPARQIKP